MIISIFPQAQHNYFLRLYFLGFVTQGICCSILFSGIQAGAEAAQRLGRIRAQLETQCSQSLFTEVPTSGGRAAAHHSWVFMFFYVFLQSFWFSVELLWES